ncbi:MAG: class I SAM-dependent methyltransferase [Acidimicrobiales bacterium]
MTKSAGWDAYLEGFHRACPGITEDVLMRCVADGRTPYSWLTDGVGSAATILDVACGSGPTMPTGADRWIGIDRSDAELRRARSSGKTAVILGDATRLPVPAASVDVVTCSMALMLVRPLDQSLTEISRVLRPGGRLLLLLPARRPLTVVDRLSYVRLFWAARSTTKFPPTELRRNAQRALGRHGLHVESDDTRRFAYRLDGVAAADRFVDSWYLPGVSAKRRAHGRARAARLAPIDIGVPFRRVVARKRQ